jgi:tetratricopeptide (TPR) repeat protein
VNGDDGRLELLLNHATGLRSTAAIALERWVHVAVTFDAVLRTVTFYIDGRPDSTHPYADACSANALDLRLGGAATGGSHFAGRIDEAKEELRKDVHLSPQIPQMAVRKDLWTEFGDLAEAENDLTRILNKFGPNSFTLFLRADIRAQRGNFAGVLADKQAAIAYKPEEPEQQRLVDAMWAPLETKYPGYAAYLKTLPEK